MAITLPSYVAPNELIQSAWGNAVVDALDELDDEKINLAGGTMTGALILNTSSPATALQAASKGYADAGFAGKLNLTGGTLTGTLTLDSTSGASLRVRKATNSPYIDLESDAGTLYARLSADVNGLNLDSQGQITFESSNVVRASLVGTALLFGKTSSNLDDTGVEIYGTGSSALGSVRSTTAATNNMNYYCRHMSAADANTELYAQFTRGLSAVVLGSITQVSTTGVAYNTTSDERLKNVLRDLDDDEIATILRLIAPVVFEFNSDPGNEHVGFLAQQLAATWPSFVDVGIVTPGRGEPDDEPELDDDGEPVAGTGFVPWMVDLAKLVPLLVAGWQQLDRRIAALEAK